jgi:hypothetical protein
MKTMLASVMLVTLGIAIGLGIGAGIVRAQPHVQGNRSITRMSDLYRSGYAIGAFDMLNAATEVWQGHEFRNEPWITFLVKQVLCLDVKAGTGAGLPAWAKDLWQQQADVFPDDSAANVMLESACR